MSHPAYPNVFAPLQLRHKTLQARINFGAHTANMAVDGYPGDRHIGYYRERALGGAGMIVVEPIPTHATGVLTRGNFRHSDDSVIPHFRRLTEACHEAAEDVVMIHQLYHVGQHGESHNSFREYWSPSGLPGLHDTNGSHAMTDAEIEETIDGFVQSARRARESGFDGIEIFSAYHAILDQFWTPYSNRRTDKWGGSFENRMRITRRVLEGIRSECGDDFIVGMAVHLDEESSASPTLEELQEIVAWHDERELMDYVTCGTGSYYAFLRIIPSAMFPQRLGVRAAEALKKACSHALVQCESHVRTPAAAEEVLAAGQADMVSIVRGQIADPHLVTKAREERADQIRPCISCNQLCWGRRSRDYWISCLINPSAGREFEWGGDRFEPAATPRRVTVVGGGPAGMEAARVAAERGHEVTLFEARSELGGLWRLAGTQPNRWQILDHIAWYERELERLGVEVRLGERFEPGGEAGDVVIIATGTTPARRGYQRAVADVDALPGVDGDDVFDVGDVLSGSAELGHRVVVLDDLQDWPAVGTAIALAEAGHEVTMLTGAAAIAGGLYHSTDDITTRRAFAKAGGKLLVSSVLAAWDNGTATVVSTLTSEESIHHFDSLVIAENGHSLDEISGTVSAETHVIGDALAPRRAWNAIYEARKLALEI